MPHHGRSRAVDTPAGRIVYREAGDGPAVLMVHGLFASGAEFDPLVARLAKRAHCLVPDLPGSGRSVPSLPFVPGWHGFARAVIGFADALSLERFDLVGHSMGGGVALLAAATAPERVRNLVVADAVCLPFRVPLRGRLPLVPVLGRALFALYGRRMFVSYFRDDVFHDPSAMDLDRVLDHYRLFAAARGMALAALRATADPRPVAEALPRVSARTLAIWGEHDRLVPVDVGRRLVAALPRATLEIVAGCGHSPFEEKSDECAALLARFFEDREPPS